MNSIRYPMKNLLEESTIHYPSKIEYRLHSKNYPKLCKSNTHSFH